MSILFTPKEAPTTPLNLQLGVFYAPRVITPPYLAYRAIEVGPSSYRIEATEEDGSVVALATCNLVNAYHRLATHLRMDLPA